MSLSRAQRAKPLVGYGAALAAVCLVSLIIGFVVGRVSLANSSMLYLLAVLSTAVVFGRGPAVFASVVAFVVFDFFFVEPLHQFTVANPQEWLSLVLFMLTATVTGQLAAGQRQRAREAEQREREAVVLYDVVRLMGESDLTDALGAVAERLRQELQIPALGMEFLQPCGDPVRLGAGDPTLLKAMEIRGGSSSRLLQTGRPPSSNQHAAPGRWVRIVPSARARVGERIDVVPIHVAEQRLGSLLLAQSSTQFHATDNRLVSAAATQIGLALDRERLHREATEAEILRRTDQLRAALLNAVSHDLRTPLATIMASAGSLQQHDVAWTEDDRQGFAEAIEQEAERLNRLVGNLLDLSRIEGGSLRPDKSWHDLGSLVEDVLTRLRPVTVHHHVVASVQQDLPPIWLDPVEVGEALYNLVENAAKYSPPATEINIDVQSDDGAINIAVSDRGVGIPPPALQHLFDPFYRAIDGRGIRAPRPQGLGLGLAVVKGLVEAHGGQVWAENRPGGGSRFVFTLPYGEVASDGSRAPEVPAA